MASAAFDLYDNAPWARFLSRCALITGGAVVGLLLTSMLGVGMDSSAPPEYAELVQASQRLPAFRLMAELDLVVWLGIGLTLLTFGAMLLRATPIRGLLIAGCGLAQLVGATGSYLRIAGVPELAIRYAAGSPDEQARLVQVYLPLALNIMSHYGLAQLVHGIGFLLVAGLASAQLGLPRWLALWLGLLGAYSFGSQIAAAAGLPLDIGPLFLAYLVLGLAGSHLTLAIVLWRRSTHAAHQARPAVATSAT